MGETGRLVRRNLAELQRQMREGQGSTVNLGNLVLRVFKCNCCGAKRTWGEAVETVGLCEWTPVLHCDRCFKVRRHEYCGTEQHEWMEHKFELPPINIFSNDPAHRKTRIIENKAFSIQ